MRRVAAAAVVLLAAACSSSAHTATGATTAAGRAATTTTFSYATTAPTTTLPAPAVSVALGGRRFVVSPTQLRVGGVVGFAGSGCPSSATVVVYVDVSSGSGGREAAVTPGPDGTWRVSARVDDAALLGASSMDATCESRASGALQFRYAPVPIRVTTFRSLRVVPGVTPAGTRVRVEPSGACPVTAVDRAEVFVVGPGPTRPVIATASSPLDGHGNWTATLAIPSSTAPGGYLVQASCGYSRAILALYPDSQLAVS